MSDRSENKPAGRARKGGLGRGLESLIPVSAPMSPSESSPEPGPYRLIESSSIEPNPWQPRATIDPEELERLADSIRLHGVLQPLVVTPSKDGGWILIAGERRWRAALSIGLDQVPVLVRDSAPQAMLELAIIENLVRADLGPLEEANAFLRLINDFGLTQQQVADRVGRSRTAVANTLRILAAPESVRAALAANRLTEGHVRAILGLEHSVDQVALGQLVVEKGLSVRQTEALVREWANRTPRTSAQIQPAASDDVRIEGRLRDAIGTRVSLKRGAKGTGGSLTIQFHSDDQLQTIYDRLVGEEHW